MKTFMTGGVLLACFCMMVHGNLLDFAQMIRNVTGKHAVPSYSFYGCYCGTGGRGKPLDATDRCCHAHDCCYAKLKANGCTPKLDDYDYTVSNGTITCTDAPDECGLLACACDKTAAFCFRRNLDTYNPKYTYKIWRCWGSRMTSSIAVYKYHTQPSVTYKTLKLICKLVFPAPLDRCQGLFKRSCTSSSFHTTRHNSCRTAKTFPAFREKTSLIGAIVVHGSLREFDKMIGQMTGKSAFPNYSGYGCYCGYGGRGAPIDATDRCCFRHDCCYSRVIRRGCRPYTDMYNYSYSNGRVTCGSGSSCERQICECDRTAVTCFRSNLRSYSTRYTYRLNTLCRGSAPSC
ncbi:uncharacterized protein LOC115482423 [Microcaecilia unicolor]|uniref:Phospholipase A2 n=1 Tax=Microcaecilia unicolor TaxID=1415580 RepID=A0A6P7ZXT9_9AMPH|nr:uncharacterized protein LOC115482423 [Microcaecilia unicolor]